MRAAAVVSALGAATVAGSLAFAGFSGTDVFLPSVGRKPGVAPSQWYTTVWAYNPTAGVANVRFALLERDQANTNPVTYDDVLQPSQTKVYENAVWSMFARETLGAIRVTSNQPIVVNARIYSQSGELRDSVGQFFAAVPAHFAAAAGFKTELLGLVSSGSSADFRYNYGFVETGGADVTLFALLYDGLGVNRGLKSYTLRPFEQKQLQLAAEFPNVVLDNGRLSVQVQSGAGKVIAFGSLVANGSQDPSTFEMQFSGELLGSGITGITAGAGLTGGGTSGNLTLGVANSGITSGMLASNSVDANKIADGAVAAAELAPGSVTKAKLAASGGSAGQVLTTDGTGLQWQSASGGLTLPWSGQTAEPTSGAAFAVVNVGGGLYGLSGAGAVGVYGNGSAGGVFGSAGSGYGVRGTSAVETGVIGQSTSGDGIRGESGGPAKAGVNGSSSDPSGYGVFGRNTAANAEGFVGGRSTGLSMGVWGRSSDASGVGVGGSGNYFGVFGSSSSGAGVYGLSEGTGVYGASNNGTGVHGASTTGYAGYFQGDVHVSGTLSKSGGSFLIDHPLDPAGKYLSHSFVESPDMKDVYDGVVQLDGSGQAWVQLPEWFEALNRDFRYQLTAIGSPAPDLHVADEIAANRFRVAGGRPGQRVSWQVTGIRQDAWANAHRIPVEVDKPGDEQGRYLHPELFGHPKDQNPTSAGR